MSGPAVRFLTLHSLNRPSGKRNKSGHLCLGEFSCEAPSRRYSKMGKRNCSSFAIRCTLLPVTGTAGEPVRSCAAPKDSVHINTLTAARRDLAMLTCSEAKLPRFPLFEIQSLPIPRKWARTSIYAGPPCWVILDSNSFRLAVDSATPQMPANKTSSPSRPSSACRSPPSCPSGHATGYGARAQEVG